MTVLIHPNAPPIGACQGPFLCPTQEPSVGISPTANLLRPSGQGQLEPLSFDEVEG